MSTGVLSVFGSQVQRGASVQADGEGGSSLRPERRRLTALLSLSLTHTHNLGCGQMTIPGYNGLIVAHTLQQTEYNLINSDSHSLNKNTQFDSGDHLIK